MHVICATKMIFIVLFIVIQPTHSSNSNKDNTLTQIELGVYGKHAVVLVDFDANITTFSTFTSTMHDFAFAFDCPTRHQLVTFYFGDLSTRIDCEYGRSLVDCVTNRIIGNISSCGDFFEVRRSYNFLFV